MRIEFKVENQNSFGRFSFLKGCPTRVPPRGVRFSDTVVQKIYAFSQLLYEFYVRELCYLGTLTNTDNGNDSDEFIGRGLSLVCYRGACRR